MQHTTEASRTMHWGVFRGRPQHEFSRVQTHGLCVPYAGETWPYSAGPLRPQTRSFRLSCCCMMAWLVANTYNQGDFAKQHRILLGKKTIKRHGCPGLAFSWSGRGPGTGAGTSAPPNKALGHITSLLSLCSACLPWDLLVPGSVWMCNPLLPCSHHSS